MSLDTNICDVIGITITLVITLIIIKCFEGKKENE